MNSIINHLRTFAREGEKEELSIVSMVEIFNSAFTLMNHQYKSRGIEIITNIEDNLPDINVIANRIEQVLINILSNARDALEDRTKPTVWINLKSTKKELIVSIADNGPGVPDNIQSKIFDPFFTTKGVGEGTGLGLSISHGIMTESGGSIFLVNRKSSGAEFILKLPIYEYAN